MCGRYVFNPGDKFFDRYDIANKDFELEPNYNTAPGEYMPVVFRESPNHVEKMKWGLIPFWAQDIRIGYKMINARSEDIDKKPSFRVPLKKHRCLIPATGFYEWKHAGKESIPFYIYLKDRPMFSFAGLFDIWKDAEGKEIRSYTIITTTPNKFMEDIHNRMPVILHEKDESTWIDKSIEDSNKLLKLLKPYPAKTMDAYTVSKRLNKATDNSPDLLTPEKHVEIEQKTLI